MSDKDYFEQSRESALRNWVLGLMLKGAGWTALIVFGVIAAILALRAFSWLLPENPNASLDLIEAMRVLSALV